MSSSESEQEDLGGPAEAEEVAEVVEEEVLKSFAELVSRLSVSRHLPFLPSPSRRVNNTLARGVGLRHNTQMGRSSHGELGWLVHGIGYVGGWWAECTVLFLTADLGLAA